jgi:hypothetical protein
MLAMIREFGELLVAFHRWRIARFQRSLQARLCPAPVADTQRIRQTTGR